MLWVTESLRVELKVSNVPRTPTSARPKMLYPMQNVLKRVPRIAKARIDMKLSRKASSYRAMAESSMIGGSRMWKKRSLR